MSDRVNTVVTIPCPLSRIDPLWETHYITVILRSRLPLIENVTLFLILHLQAKQLPALILEVYFHAWPIQDRITKSFGIRQERMRFAILLGKSLLFNSETCSFNLKKNL